MDDRPDVGPGFVGYVGERIEMILNFGVSDRLNIYSLPGMGGPHNMS